MLFTMTFKHQYPFVGDSELLSYCKQSHNNLVTLRYKMSLTLHLE